MDYFIKEVEPGCLGKFGQDLDKPEEGITVGELRQMMWGQESLRMCFSSTLFVFLLHFSIDSHVQIWALGVTILHCDVFFRCGFAWLPMVVTITGSLGFIYFLLLFFDHILRHFRYFTGDNSQLF